DPDRRPGRTAARGRAMTGTDEVRARLAALLDGPPRRRSVAEAETALMARLDSPARVGLFGLPGAGKRRLANLLLGADLLPASPALPTLVLRRGAATRCTLVLADGSRPALDGLPFDRIAGLAPLMVEIEAPLPALAG